MRTPVTEEMVAMLGRAAGFALAPERCRLLAAQLEWLLGEAGHLSDIDLTGVEPVCSYQIEVLSSVMANHPRLTPDDHQTQGEPE